MPTARPKEKAAPRFPMVRPAYDAPPTDLEIAEADAHAAFCVKGWGEPAAAWRAAYFALMNAEGPPATTRCHACHLVRRGGTMDTPCRRCGWTRAAGSMSAADPEEWTTSVQG